MCLFCLNLQANNLRGAVLVHGDAVEVCSFCDDAVIVGYYDVLGFLGVFGYELRQLLGIVLVQGSINLVQDVEGCRVIFLY